MARLPVRSPLGLGVCVFQSLSDILSPRDTQGPRRTNNPAGGVWAGGGVGPSRGARLRRKATGGGVEKRQDHGGI